MDTSWNDTWSSWVRCRASTSFLVSTNGAKDGKTGTSVGKDREQICLAVCNQAANCM
ncbi:hypothetical protein GCM10023147_44310 [Tsukamurella soli]|uniref:Uncharacterized protein n=1 Tax=Tsukamurella soli TaxID=644556 RepID=A0ABP8KBA0_9ACTN